ncbi:hypothetical protein LEN26_002704, partial [Aphanomyces euteiches]
MSVSSMRAVKWGSWAHNEVAIRKRHDAALKTIAHAVLDARPECILRVNSSVPGFDGDVLKPDIQLLDEVKKTVVICDLALAYEDDQLHDGNTVFERVAKDKTSKYSPSHKPRLRTNQNILMDTQSNDIVCFCTDRSSRCIPSTMRATLSLPAPDEVWCLERSRFEPRVPPSPALSPASRRAIARARLRTPSPSRRAQSTTDHPVEALLMSATAPPLTSSAPACPSAPTIDSSRSGEVLPVLLPPDDARQPPSTDSPATSSASANHSISRGEVLPDFVPAASTATPIPSDPLASATAMLRDILDSSAEPQGPTSKQARLDLPPNLSEAAAESLERSLQLLGTSLILALDDTPSWEEAERAIMAFPAALYRTVREQVDATSASSPKDPLAPPSEPRAPCQHRPPPVTRFQVEHTMESAQMSLSGLQRSSTATPRSIYRARRKLGRLQKAWSRIQVRRMFVMDEKRCVDSIFRQAAGVALKPSKCEIPLPTIADHFSAVNRPPTTFDAERPSGARFLEILRGLPPADFNANALSDDITMDEIEDALNHANLV